MATYDFTLDFDHDSTVAYDQERSPRTFDFQFTPAESGGAAGLVPSYRMRGFDQNVAVNAIVFWNSNSVDSAAADYSGSAGPVVDIVVHHYVGQ